jgi:hypothetical protein
MRGSTWSKLTKAMYAGPVRSLAFPVVRLGEDAIMLFAAK